MKLFLKASLIFLFSLFIACTPVIAEDLSKFSEIHSDVLEDYSTYAFKFTNLGTQFKIIPTNGGHGNGRAFSVDDFKPFQRSDYDYGNDDISVGSIISLSNQEFKNFIDAIGNYPELQSIENVIDPDVSLMIIRDVGSNAICWEHLATEAEIKIFFDLLYNSIDPSRQDILEEIKRCKMHMGGS